MTKPDEPFSGHETSALLLDWTAHTADLPTANALPARTGNTTREEPGAGSAGRDFRPVLDRPPTDLFELGLEAECYAGMARAAPHRGKPVHNLQLKLEQAFVGDTPYENYPDHLDRTEPIQGIAMVSSAAAPRNAGSEARAKLPAPTRLSGRYQLMLGLLAGIIAVGGVALQWASERSASSSPGWSLQGPIGLDVHGKENR